MISTLRRKPNSAVIAAVNSNFSVASPPSFSTLRRPPLPLQTLILSHYRRGKFHNLLQNVVASPSFLLAACNNLRHHAPNSPPPLTVDSVSTQFFSFHELAVQLSKNSFDVEPCCGSVSSERGSGVPLVVPNLKLKVVLEAVRIVLEAIYDDRFVTFSYGGRAGMGRHTAVRYLKNSVENPSWWFSVKFDKDLIFGCRHVEKLCLMLGEKIEDDALLDLIRKLFECNVVRIDLGGVCLGRGLPQECPLSSILVNVYFNGFDKEVQELRLKMNEGNPKFGENELVLDEDKGSVFYRPLKIYAVRYLNEILIITSGTKMLTVDLKNRVVKYLEEDLDLKVDRLRTHIHSAVSEKIDFIGMELQAVAPSVLRPPMTEKAIRARKKYLRQKEVKLLELKNARERNRKKLGMKLWNHVFKKSKRSNGLKKIDFQIESEVREIYSTWANEVVSEFLKSVDERWEWHRKLSAGDFLSLGRIRDKLPQELVDAYDNFQHQVEKHLNPKRAKKQLEENVRREKEEEEAKYARKTIDDLTRRCIKVDAPIELLRKAIKMVGFTNKMGRPRPISLLMVFEDIDIIKWYAGVGRRWLDFFCCCNNFRKVKILVSYHLRFSCILTLAEKHEATKRLTMGHFTKDLKVDGVKEVLFPSEREVKMMGDKNLSDPMPVDGALTMALIRLASDEPSHRCIAHFCERNDTIVYRIRLLQKHLDLDSLDEDKWVPGMGAIHDSLHKKCAPLCSHHISELYMGRLTLQDIDFTSFVDV